MNRDMACVLWREIYIPPTVTSILSETHVDHLLAAGPSQGATEWTPNPQELPNLGSKR